MFKNYLKVAWRNLKNKKAYAIINIGGLAIGMAVAILIGLWIHDELSYNKVHGNYDRIGQIRSISTEPSSGAMESGEFMPIPMGAVLKNQYGHLFDQVLLSWGISDYTLRFGEKNVTKTGQFIEAGAPEMLSLKMLKGSYASLIDPHSIILSKSTADAIFGNLDPINQDLKIDNRMDVKVAGVYEDLPKNSRFGEVQFFSPWALWVSSNDWVKRNENFWGNTSFGIYVELRPDVTLETAQAGIEDFYLESAPKDFYKNIDNTDPKLSIYPMEKWHLYSEFINGQPEGGRITFVWLFGTIGVFVLLLACINFVNLSTARSEKRSKEVGIRKTIGSVRGQLIGQFFIESMLVVLSAFFLSCILIIGSLKWFNTLADKDISLPFANPYFWLASIVFIMLTGILTGLYPALYLSSVHPINALKGALKKGRFGTVPRKVLVVVQFTVSAIMIVGTIVVYQQIQYARNRPIGYDIDGLVTLAMNDPNYQGRQEVLKSELLNTGMVENMALSNCQMTSLCSRASGFTWQGKNPESPSGFNLLRVSPDFGEMLDWEFIAGRDFSRAFASDSTGVILNETAATYTGLKNPIGQFIRSEDGSQSWQIVGVIKDVLTLSPYEPVAGTFYFFDPDYSSTDQIFIKIRPTVSAGEALSQIESVFRKVVPSASFDYKFVDQEYAAKFIQEKRIGKLAFVFAILAVLISCLGIYGLASFIAEQRTREIGIRRVLGASVLNMWKMLSKDFAYLVITSCLIAAPVANYFMTKWLMNYTYRTPISLWIFALTGLGVVCISLITVSFHAIKAANADPVRSLRSE